MNNMLLLKSYEAFTACLPRRRSCWWRHLPMSDIICYVLSIARHRHERIIIMMYDDWKKLASVSDQEIILMGDPVYKTSIHAIQFKLGVYTYWVSVQKSFAFWTRWPNCGPLVATKWLKMVVSDYYMEKYPRNPIQTCIWLKFHWNLFLKLKWQQVSISSSNGLALNRHQRHQAIILTNFDLVLWWLMTSVGMQFKLEMWWCDYLWHMYYFQASGNKVSRQSVLCGSQNIVLNGKVRTIIVSDRLVLS